jgi:hypothetical protein
MGTRVRIKTCSQQATNTVAPSEASIQKKKKRQLSNTPYGRLYDTERKDSDYAKLTKIYEENGPLFPSEALQKAHIPYSRAKAKLADTVRSRVRDRTSGFKQEKSNSKKAEPQNQVLDELAQLGVVHRFRFCFFQKVPWEVVAWIRGVAVKGKRRGVWYEINNRNRMLCFKDHSGDFSVLLHRNGRCSISVSRRFQRKLRKESMRDELHQRVNDMFVRLGEQHGVLVSVELDGVKTHVFSENVSRDFKYRWMVWGSSFMQSGGERVFELGQELPRWSTTAYKSVGICWLGTDGSHPKAVEAHENIPPWAYYLVDQNTSILDVFHKLLAVQEQQLKLEEKRVKQNRRLMEQNETVIGLNRQLNLTLNGLMDAQKLGMKPDLKKLPYLG